MDIEKTLNYRDVRKDKALAGRYGEPNLKVVRLTIHQKSFLMRIPQSFTEALSISPGSYAELHLDARARTITAYLGRREQG